MYSADRIKRSPPDDGCRERVERGWWRVNGAVADRVVRRRLATALFYLWIFRITWQPSRTKGFFRGRRVHAIYIYFVRNVNSAANPAAARRRIASSLRVSGRPKDAVTMGLFGYAIPAYEILRWKYTATIHTNIQYIYICITKLRRLFSRVCGTPTRHIT